MIVSYQVHKVSPFLIDVIVVCALVYVDFVIVALSYQIHKVYPFLIDVIGVCALVYVAQIWLLFFVFSGPPGIDGTPGKKGDRGPMVSYHGYCTDATKQLVTVSWHKRIQQPLFISVVLIHIQIIRKPLLMSLNCKICSHSYYKIMSLLTLKNSHNFA